MTDIPALVWRSIWPSWNPEELPRALRLCEQTPPGGVTLFRRHLPTLAETLELNRRLLAAAGGRTCIAVDQEGGPVERLPQPFPPFPAGSSWAQGGGDPTSVQAAHQRLGMALRQLGFSIDFAPVCDLDVVSDHPALSQRCFAAEPAACATLVAAAVRGLAAAGLHACAKHFPGHGAVLLDSHVDLDTLERSLDQVRAAEWIPFAAAVDAGVPLIMAAHFKWPALDPAGPTTFSRPLVDCVRTDLRFDGVLLTDDLEMGAIAAHWARDEAALLALTAGYDAVLFCKSLEQAQQAAETCIREAEQSAAFRALLETAAGRIQRLGPADPGVLRPSDGLDAWAQALNWGGP